MFSPLQDKQFEEEAASVCFLCSSSCRQENAEADSGRRIEKRIRRNHKYKGDFEQSSSSSKAQSQNAAKRILLKYLVARCENEELKDTLTTANSPIQFCNECARLAKEVQDLHLKLESIQMMLIEKLKQAKGVIVGNSTTFQRLSEGGGDIKNEDKKSRLMQLACQLRIFIGNKNDTNEADVPLVFLEKFVGRKTFPEIVSSTSKSNQVQQMETRHIRHISDCQPKTEYIPGEIKEAGIGKSSNSSVPVDKRHSEKSGKAQVKEEVMSDVDENSNQDDDDRDVGFDPVTFQSDSDDNFTPKLPSNNKSTSAARKSKLSRKSTTKNPKNKPLRRMLKCNLCSASFCSVVTLASHKTRVHGQSKLKCELCPPSPGRYFARPSGLYEHLSISHPAEDAKKFPCSQCPREFPLKSLRKRHETMSHGEPNFSCDQCDYVTTMKQSIKTHLRTVHSTSRIICEICGFAAKHEETLRRHRLRKHDPGYQMKPKVMPSVKNFECSLCLKKFSLKGNLKEHMSTHSEETPFHCDVCGQAFKYKITFRAHMLSQHGQASEKHDCPQCSKSFTTKFRLGVHMTTHTDERKYECHLCGTRTKRKGSLMRHLKNVHGIGEKEETRGQWVCQECGKVFPTAFCVKRHLLVHEKGGTSRNRKRGIHTQVAGVANVAHGPGGGDDES